MPSNEAIFQSVSLTSSPKSSPLARDPSFSPCTGLQSTTQDEELFDQYFTSTYLTISSKPRILEAYRFGMPEEALSHPHLMHAMLAFAAAHLMHIRPDAREVYENKARRHQHLGKELSPRPSATGHPT